ncbi:MAG: LuxR C-terminal-related transcriptional regulator [Acidimicrobiales bacterium]
MVIAAAGDVERVELSWLRAAKTRVPSLPPDAVSRPSLSLQLDRDVPFTLVSAPPGFGKTVAVADWAHATEVTVAWLTLDRFDDEPASLWAGIADAVDSLAGVPPAPAPEGAPVAGSRTHLSALLDRLRSAADRVGPVAVVLDELQWVRSPDLWRQLAYVIDHLPPGVRMVGVTRGDPHLPLGRWRAESRLVDVREADLRLDLDETALLLAPMVELAEDEIRQVHDTTDGWAVAVRLAGSAMAKSPDPDGLLERFGHDQVLVDYIVSEAVEGLTDDEHQAMVALALHGTLDRESCAVLCGRRDAWQDLVHLVGENLFVMATDSSRTVVRLHSLVAELVVAEASARAPGLVDDLRRRGAELSDARTVPPRDAVSIDLTDRAYDTTRLPVHIEPFTERERAVLALLPTHLTYAEIAAELFLSINTVKTYVKSIYRKLGVGSRRDSVSAARTIGLL